MRVFLIIILSIQQYSYALASSKYTYSDYNIRITVEWDKSKYSDSETVIVKLKAFVNILVPDHEGCFSLDSVLEIKGHFRNYNCPVYILHETYGNYCSFAKDSTITYQWNVPSAKKMKRLSFNIIYIPTNLNEYENMMRKKKFLQRVNSKGKNIILISPSDQKYLIRTPQLDIIP